LTIYAYTDVLVGFEEGGYKEKKLPAGSALTAGKESGLTKEQIDALVERGAAGEEKHVEVLDNNIIGDAPTLEEREAATAAQPASNTVAGR